MLVLLLPELHKAHTLSCHTALGNMVPGLLVKNKYLQDSKGYC